MCGREESLVAAEVEGAELNICPACAKHGQVKKMPGPSSFFSAGRLFSSEQKFVQKEKLEFKVTDGYPSLLRSAREKLGMNQEDFAKLLNERESVVAKWESGGLKPRIEAARQIGRILGINLVEEDEEVGGKIELSRKNDEPTLGDFVKVRKRKF